MEFKEFENPEQKDYDIKVGNKNINNPSKTVDDSLNSEEGIDLNMIDEDYGKVPEMPIITNQNPDFEINEYGEIIREPKGKSR